MLLASIAPAAAGVRAYVYDPPSNVRATPNGAIQCSVNQPQYIDIYGSNSQGSWFETDYCGERGYIHSSQITQPEVTSTAPQFPTSGYCILRGQVVPDINCY